MSCAQTALTPQMQERMMSIGRDSMPRLVGSDEDRIAALEREVAELRASLAEVRRLTLGYRWANSPDSEDRATYQAGVE